MDNEKIMKIKELTNQLNIHRHKYYNENSPVLSDAAYDHLVDKLKKMENETNFKMADSPTTTVGAPITSGLKKVKHEKPLLSLEKTKNVSSLVKFIGDEPVILMHKIDGLTLKLEYENGKLLRASTRGDGNTGEDVTHNACSIRDIPATLPTKAKLTIVGEAYIDRPAFEKIKASALDESGREYKNARNMAAGSVRCHDPQKCMGRRVRFSPFAVSGDTPFGSKSKNLAILGQMGFSPCRHVHAELGAENDEETIAGIMAVLMGASDIDGTPIDGIVITYNDLAFSGKQGHTGHHYKDGIAFKPDDEMYETTLISVEWQVSRSGELSPVANFETIKIDGCNVSKASLHNLSYIENLELFPGCKLLVSKRNMVIPHIEDNLDRGRYDESAVIPKTCPCCGKTASKQTRQDGPKGKPICTMHCANPGCPAQSVRKFAHFCGKKAMDIEGLSESILEKFFAQGWLNDFTDIYRLDSRKDEIVKMDGFGEKSWARLWDAIQASRDTTFERYIIAMDIPMVGKHASAVLAEKFDSKLDAFEQAVENGYNFTQLDGFGINLHINIHGWFTKEENKKLWKEMQKMANIEKRQPIQTGTGNPFAGKVIVATGKLEHYTREGINSKIRSLGAIAGDSVTKNTDYLIVGEKAGSKLQKAQSMGVPTLIESEFIEMAGGI